MKPIHLLLFTLLFILLLQSCKPLQHTTVIDIEIVEPGKVKLNKDYKKLAIRYNNCNVSLKPNTKHLNPEVKGTKSLDNVEQIVPSAYYNYFVLNLSKQEYFDTIFQIQPNVNSTIMVLDTLNHPMYFKIDSTKTNSKLQKSLNSCAFPRVLKEDSIGRKNFTSEINLHREFGLYQHSDLGAIYDSTSADILLSLDYFSEVERTAYNQYNSMANTNVTLQVYWNLYDLKSRTNIGVYNKKDNEKWGSYVRGFADYKKQLPSQEEALLLASDIVSWRFIEYLVPHWVSVQRMYYKSTDKQLKQAEEFVKQNNWKEAAIIWKTNTTNSNKIIEAKCKYNMALACEMQGNYNAALEWVAESFHVLGQNNEEHARNCKDYIRILGQRKHDIKLIETQLGLIN